MIEKTTTAVAAGAVSSPIWLPSLADISQTAALLLPIAGLMGQTSFLVVVTPGVLQFPAEDFCGRYRGNIGLRNNPLEVDQRQDRR